MHYGAIIHYLYFIRLLVFNCEHTFQSSKKKENVKSIFQQAVNGIEEQAANDRKVAKENVNNNNRNGQTQVQKPAVLRHR